MGALGEINSKDDKFKCQLNKLTKHKQIITKDTKFTKEKYLAQSISTTQINIYFAFSYRSAKKWVKTVYFVIFHIFYFILGFISLPNLCLFNFGIFGIYLIIFQNYSLN